MTLISTSARTSGGGIPDPVTVPVTIEPSDQDVDQALSLVFSRIAAAAIDGALRIVNSGTDIHLWSTSSDYTITAPDNTVTALLRLTSIGTPLFQANLVAGDGAAYMQLRGSAGQVHKLAVQSDGSGQLGLFGASPTAQETLTRAGVTAAQLWDVLAAYGLVAEP